MGYQESYVRMKKREDFDKLVNAFKDVGKDFYESSGTMPISIITLTKPIEGNLDYMGIPEQTYRFDIGEKFVYIVGERCIQRCASRMFDNKKIDNVEIYFAECLPSSDIFDPKSNIATQESFVWNVQSDK